MGGSNGGPARGRRPHPAARALPRGGLPGAAPRHAALPRSSASRACGSPSTAIPTTPRPSAGCTPTRPTTTCVDGDALPRRAAPDRGRVRQPRGSHARPQDGGAPAGRVLVRPARPAAAGDARRTRAGQAGLQAPGGVDRRLDASSSPSSASRLRVTFPCSWPSSSCSPRPRRAPSVKSGCSSTGAWRRCGASFPTAPPPRWTSRWCASSPTRRGSPGPRSCPRPPLEAGPRGTSPVELTALGRFADVDRFFRQVALHHRLLDVESLVLRRRQEDVVKMTTVIRLPFRPVRAPLPAPPDGTRRSLPGVPRAQADAVRPRPGPGSRQGRAGGPASPGAAQSALVPLRDRGHRPRPAGGADLRLLERRVHDPWPDRGRRARRAPSRAASRRASSGSPSSSWRGRPRAAASR